MSFINFIFVLAATGVLAAQDTSATVSGEIGLFPADIVLTLQTPPHTVFSVRTESAGKFRFTVLPAGTYALTVAQLGFQPLKLKSIQLANGEQKLLPGLRMDVAPSDTVGHHGLSSSNCIRLTTALAI